MSETILPRNVRCMTRGYILSAKLTWAERLKLIIGGRVLVAVTQYSEHKPGQTATQGRFYVTEHNDIKPAVLEFEGYEQRVAKENAEKAEKGVVL